MIPIQVLRKRVPQNEITIDGEVSGLGWSMNARSRIKFDYQPAEAPTRLYPGCAEGFSVWSVEVEFSPGTWTEIKHYDGAEIVQRIIDYRDEKNREWEAA